MDFSEKPVKMNTSQLPAGLNGTIISNIKEGLNYELPKLQTKRKVVFVRA